MEERYLSIKEFSELAKVSIQSVYKRINKENDIIHQFIKIKDGKKVISSAAIDKIYNNDSGVYEEVEEKAAPDSDIILLLKEQVERQQKELDAKNQHIEKLNKQLEESSKREERFQVLLENQQKLAAMDRQKILELESAEQKKKRNIFSIFKRKEKGDNANG